MQSRSYPRATEPDLNSLANAIRAHIIAACGNDSFYLSWTGAKVVLEHANLSNVNNATVQAAVDAAHVRTNAGDAKALVDNMPPDERAKMRAILGALNYIRGCLNPAKPALSEAEFMASIKSELDGIVLDRPAKP